MLISVLASTIVPVGDTFGIEAQVFERLCEVCRGTYVVEGDCTLSCYWSERWRRNARYKVVDDDTGKYHVEADEVFDDDAGNYYVEVDEALDDDTGKHHVEADEVFDDDARNHYLEADEALDDHVENHRVRADPSKVFAHDSIELAGWHRVDEDQVFVHNSIELADWHRVDEDLLDDLDHILGIRVWADDGAYEVMNLMG